MLGLHTKNRRSPTSDGCAPAHSEVPKPELKPKSSDSNSPDLSDCMFRFLNEYCAIREKDNGRPADSLSSVSSEKEGSGLLISASPANAECSSWPTGQHHTDVCRIVCKLTKRVFSVDREQKECLSWGTSEIGKAATNTLNSPKIPLTAEINV